MKGIAFYNIKGGCGKTTSAINVSYILAKEGKKVLLVDLDPQANSSDFYELDDCEYPLTIADVLIGDCKVDKAIYHSKYNGLDFIPSTILLGRTEKMMTANTTVPQQFKLKSALKDIENQYDYVIFDCSPVSESLININGLAASDQVFIPLKSDKWTIDGLNYTVETIKTVTSFNFQLHFGGAFFVQNERRVINAQATEIVKKMLGDKLLDISISKNKNAEECSYLRIPIVEYQKGESTIAKDYIKLTEKIVEITNR